jgi:thymidylate synthase
MYIFESNNLNSLYVQLVHSLIKEGQEIEKTGKRIKELYPCIIKLTNPKEGILLVNGRPYSPAFAFAEAIWNLTGDSESWLCSYNAIYQRYFTDGKLKAGYGNRIFNWDQNTNQFDLVVERLKSEPNTEHASITIFNPTYDLRNPKFVPCITKLKFRIRNNKLHMTSFMRAQDIWLGLPYDINLLLTLFQLMSIRLNVEMGDYYHYCDVLRLYEVNYVQASKIGDYSVDANTQINLEGICDFQRFHFYRYIIKDLPDDSLELIGSEPEYWKNGIKCCIAYKHLHAGNIDKALQVVDTITNGFKQQFEIWAQHYHDLPHPVVDKR